MATTSLLDVVSPEPVSHPLPALIGAYELQTDPLVDLSSLFFKPSDLPHS